MSSVTLLLSTGKADANVKDQAGLTPPWLATKGWHEVVVQLLLAMGKADVDAKDGYGWTPLSWDAERRHEPVSRLLNVFTATSQCPSKPLCPT